MEIDIVLELRFFSFHFSEIVLVLKFCFVLFWFLFLRFLWKLI